MTKLKKVLIFHSPVCGLKEGNIMANIYLDNAATTKTSKRAIEAMLPYFDGVYGNPSSLHSAGQAAAEALQNARERIAACLGCTAREITFTSGGRSRRSR